MNSKGRIRVHKHLDLKCSRVLCVRADCCVVSVSFSRDK